MVKNQEKNWLIALNVRVEAKYSFHQCYLLVNLEQKKHVKDVVVQAYFQS